MKRDLKELEPVLKRKEDSFRNMPDNVGPEWRKGNEPKIDIQVLVASWFLNPSESGVVLGSHGYVLRSPESLFAVKLIPVHHGLSGRSNDAVRTTHLSLAQNEYDMHRQLFAKGGPVGAVYSGPYRFEFREASWFAYEMECLEELTSTEERIVAVKKIPLLLRKIHALGFYHGDLHFSNVMMCGEKELRTIDRLRIIDFGTTRRFPKERPEAENRRPEAENRRPEAEMEPHDEKRLLRLLDFVPCFYELLNSMHKNVSNPAGLSSNVEIIEAYRNSVAEFGNVPDETTPCSEPSLMTSVKRVLKKLLGTDF